MEKKNLLITMVVLKRAMFLPTHKTEYGKHKADIGKAAPTDNSWKEAVSRSFISPHCSLEGKRNSLNDLRLF